MSKFSAIVCDHCDSRDILEHPASHGIKSYRILYGEYSAPTPISGFGGQQATTMKPPAHQNETIADLCDECYKNLITSIAQNTQQAPRSTNG